MTILFVTHDIDEAVYLGQRVLVLSASPTVVQEQLTIDLPAERDQLHTRVAPRFAELRTHVYEQIQAAKRGVIARRTRRTSRGRSSGRSGDRRRPDTPVGCPERGRRATPLRPGTTLRWLVGGGRARRILRTGVGGRRSLAQHQRHPRVAHVPEGLGGLADDPAVGGAPARVGVHQRAYGAVVLDGVRRRPRGSSAAGRAGRRRP